MAFDWREGVKGALMSPEQFSKYQDRNLDAQKTQAQREFEIMKMIYQDKLTQDRSMALEEKKQSFRQESGREKRSQQMDDEIYKRMDMTREQYEARGQVPHWVPRGSEQKYQIAKQHYSEDEIKRYLRA